MKNNLSKTYATTAIIAIALVSMLMLVPTDALAANPKSSPSNPITCSASPSQFGTGVSSRTLTCTGKISGLGNVDQAVAQLQAQVQADCTNPGSKGQKPPGHITVVSEPQVFQVRNGAIDPFTATATASANCPSSHTPSVGQFTNIVVVVNGVPVFTAPGPV
jgi:hypothetical protein